MERTARRMLGTMTAAMKMIPRDRDLTNVSIEAFAAAMSRGRDEDAKKV
jgi:hypothetical protein